MLNEAGRLMGDLTVARLDDDRFWLTGSYYLQEWHMRWFLAQLPASGVTLTNVTDAFMGFSVSGPASRTILDELAHDDLSNEGLGFLGVRSMDVGTRRERWSAASRSRVSSATRSSCPRTATARSGMSCVKRGRRAGCGLIGDRAIDSLRLEKGYGIWAAEFREDFTPAMSGLDRFVAFDNGGFIGADAARRERDAGPPAQRLVLLEVHATDADASADEGIWIGDRRVGFVTSGAYGHHVGMSLALAYVDSDVAASSPELTVFVVGEPRAARILPEIPYDPKGAKLRDLSV